MRLQISLDADTYMCSWAEELERQRGAGPSNDDAAAASSAAPAAADDRGAVMRDADPRRFRATG